MDEMRENERFGLSRLLGAEGVVRHGLGTKTQGW